MKPQPPKKAADRNWVAKHAQMFCKAAVHRNKKKDYLRTPKHRQRDFGVSFWKMVGGPGGVPCCSGGS